MREYADAIIGAVNVARPAAGAAPTYTQPGATVAELLAVTFTLVADATAGNRTPVVQLLGPDGTIYGAASSGYALAPSGTATFSFCRGLSEWDQANDAFASGPVPLFVLSVGFKVSVVVQNLAAADQLSAVKLLLAQWPVREGGD